MSGVHNGKFLRAGYIRGLNVARKIDICKINFLAVVNNCLNAGKWFSAMENLHGKVNRL